MGLGLNPLERLARARSDLRMGAVVALRDNDSAALALAAETATAGRLADLRALGAVDLALTGWRAETLKARAYDGEIWRAWRVPSDADLGWVRATADPSTDLAWPMKGPYPDPARRRGGICTAPRSRSPSRRISCRRRWCCRDRCRRSTAIGRATRLALVDICDVRPGPAPPAGRDRGGAGAAGSVRRPDGSGCSGPTMAARSITPSTSARRTGRRRCCAGCIRPASPATCWAA